MSNRDNFVWRPNDNSVTTNLRYDLEAAHWVKAFKGASVNTTASLGEVLGVIGLILSLVFLIIFFIVQGIIEIVNFISTKRFEARERKIQKAWIEAKIATETAAKEAAALQEKQRVKDTLKVKLANVTDSMIHNQDVLFKKAALIVVNKQKISLTNLQIDLEIDFDRACKIMDELEAFGIISGFNSKFPRKVLIETKKTLQLLFELMDDVEIKYEYYENTGNPSE